MTATQLELFEPGLRAEEADKIAALLAGSEQGYRSMGLTLARQKNAEPWALLVRHINQNHEKDFKKVWDGFERTGEMVYYDSHFGCTRIKLLEDETGRVHINGHVLYVSGPDDEFGGELTRKYIRLACAHIASHPIYFNAQINGTWKK